MYQSQSDKERFCRHYTVKRKHALPEKIIATTLFSRFRSIFCSFCLISGFAQFSALFVLFHKTVLSAHKTVDNKAPDEILPYSDNALFRIRQQIRVTRELLDQTALITILLKKQINITHTVLEFCTGRFVTSSPWESTLRNNLNKRINLIHPFIQIIPQGGLPRGTCDKSSRAEFQNSMCGIDLFFFFFKKNGFKSSLVEQLASDPNLLPYF